MTLEKYPINIDHLEMLMSIIQEDKHKIPDVWKQLTRIKDKFKGIETETLQFGCDCLIYLNPLELGILTGIIQKDRQRVPGVWKQLMDLRNKFLEDAGVETIDMGNYIKMKDKDGTEIIRKKYEWEK